MVGDQWCCGIKTKCFCFTLTLSYFMFKLKFTLTFLLTFSLWCRIAKSECMYFIFYFNSINCASMNECFTDPIFRNFSVERKKKMREGVRKRKEKKLRERLDSYSVSTVSSDLQVA